MRGVEVGAALRSGAAPVAGARVSLGACAAGVWAYGTLSVATSATPPLPSHHARHDSGYCPSVREVPPTLEQSALLLGCLLRALAQRARHTSALGQRHAP